MPTSPSQTKAARRCQRLGIRVGGADKGLLAKPNTRNPWAAMRLILAASMLLASNVIQAHHCVVLLNEADSVPGAILESLWPDSQ
jgi:hypothetical protein